MSRKEDEEYSKLDFSKLHGWYHDEIGKITSNLGRVLDIGSGSGELMINLARKFSYLEIIGVDASERMIEISNENIRESGVSGVKSIYGAVPNLTLEKNSFDTIVSKVVLHHFDNPLDFWKQIKDSIKEDGKIFVMDLRRPDSIEDVDEILGGTDDTHNEINKRLLRQSLMSSFTEDEIKKQLDDVGLNLKIDKFGSKYLFIHS